MSSVQRLGVILSIFIMTCSCEHFDLCSEIDCEFKGRISEEGQTVAGQMAQNEIAEAIVNLVEEKLGI